MRQAAAVCVAMEPELPSDHETLVQGTRARSMRPRSERVLLLATTSVVIAAAVFLMSKARPHNTALRTNAEAQLKEEKNVCPTPGEKFDQPQKGCPNALDASSCLAGNKNYDSFQEAWAGCGTELECHFVMRFGTDTGYEYYLRRNSDPSMEMDNADSMTYSCREEVKASSRVPSHRACSLPDYYDFDLPQKGCPQPSNSSCVRNNQNFPDLAQAWLACAEEPECGVILRWGTGTGYVYYLRRRSDPSVEMAGAESMLFSCSDQSPTTSSMIKKSTEVCSPAAGNFDLPPKRCSPLPVGCIGKNERYTIFAEAWAACGQSSECDLLMRWTDGRYYLRRGTDPDISAWTSGGSLRYSCDTRGAVITAPALAANLVSTRAPKTYCDYPPTRSFDLAPKRCAHLATGCILNNKRFSDIADAWAQCTESSECGVIMKWERGYYLRRISDPDSSDWTGGGSMLYTCDGERTSDKPIVTKALTTAAAPATTAAPQDTIGECGIPEPKWSMAPKKCAPLPVGCLGNNEDFTSVEEAWKACGRTAGCDLVMMWTEHRFYMRRATDPDLGHWTFGGCMPYSCAGEPASETEIAVSRSPITTRAPKEVCSPAAESFDLAPKRCASQAIGCILNNKRYQTFVDSWAACGLLVECELIMKWEGGFYLRRSSDPDSSDWTGGASMRYSCTAAA